MKRQVILGLLFLFLLFPLACGQLIINPSEFSVEIVGGESISKNFIIEWGGKTPVVCYLSYKITQANGFYNGKELWINFSENPIILEPTKPKTIEFYIYSSPNIQPDIYSITIEAKVNLEEVEKEVEKLKYKRIVILYENKTKIVEMNRTIETLNKTIDYLNQELLSAYEKYNISLGNLSLNITNLKGVINLLNQTLFERESEILKYENLINSLTEENRKLRTELNIIKIVSSIAIITLIVLNFAFAWRLLKEGVK